MLNVPKLARAAQIGLGSRLKHSKNVIFCPPRMSESNRLSFISQVVHFSDVPKYTKILEDLIITKTCAKKIRTLNCKSGESPRRLRLAVEGGGCSGFQYLFTMEDSSTALSKDDVTFERDDATVVVDEMSMDFVRGSTIDYTQEMIRSSFVVLNNPNSETGCGCGASFALKMD